MKHTRNTIKDYQMTIRWSEAEERFIVHFPAFPLVMADGQTPEEAAAEGSDALGLALDVLYERGHEVPQPDACDLALA